MDRNRKISIMGIVNLTDDSYFADSRCTDVQAYTYREIFCFLSLCSRKERG